MRLPWGGLEAEAVGAWDRLAEQVRALDGHRDHQPRDPGHRLALAGRPRADVARPRPRRRRDPPGALGARPGAPDPRRVAGERQAPQRHAATRASSTGSSDPTRESRIATWFWGVQEIPDILDRWGADLPPERVHLVTVPPPGGAARPAVEAVQPGLRARRHRPRPRGRAGQPVARRPRDRADPPDQPRRQPRRSSPPDYRPLVRELLAHQTLSRRTWLARGWRCRPTCTRGRRSSRRRGSPRSSAAGYDVVGDLARPARRRRPAPVRRPRPARARREVAGAAVDAIKALLLENARLRASRGAARARELARAPGPRSSGPTCGRRTGSREKAVRAARAGSAVGRGLLRVYRLARGRSSRSA